MTFIIGSYTSYCGHTWLSFSDDGRKIYSLRSLGEGSSMIVYDSAVCRASTVAVLPDADVPCLGEFKTTGRHSCHITLLGKQAVLSDYSSGTLTLFDLDGDGMPYGDAKVLTFPYRIADGVNRAGIDPSRQASGHLHSSWLSPDGRKLVAVDLGNDCLYVFNVTDGKLDMALTDENGPVAYETFALPDGCGPRHCAFGKDALYVATELSDEVIVYSWPEMKLLQRVTVNPVKPRGGGHVTLSGDGRHLYVSSRLENDGIGIFAVAPDGLLTYAGYQKTASHPRHFSISEDGTVLAAACRDSDRIEIFFRDKTSGLLTKTSEIHSVKPVFIDLSFASAKQPLMEAFKADKVPSSREGI